MMGKTPRPLIILVHPDVDSPTFDELREQGHTVHRMGETVHFYDLILGTNCWQMNRDLHKYLPLAIRAARGSIRRRRRHDIQTVSRRVAEDAEAVEDYASS